MTAPELVVEEEDDGTPLSDREKAEALSDFRDWSGGFDPWDGDAEDIKESGMPPREQRYLEQCRVTGHA